MELHFKDWMDYKGVAFSIQLQEWGQSFSGFGGGGGGGGGGGSIYL